MKVLLLTLLTFSSAAFAKARILIRPYTELKVSKEISLSDVAEFHHTSKDLQMRIGKILLAAAPDEGEQVSFSSMAISEMIRDQLPRKELSQLQLIIPRKITVSVHKKVWSESEVKDELISAWQPLCPKCRLEIKNLSLPIGTVKKWKIKTSSVLPRGGFNVAVEVTKGEASTLLWVRGDLVIKKHVPVASRALFIGDHLAKSDVSWEWRDVTMSFDGVPSESELAGDLVRSPLRAQDIIWSRDLKKEKALKRGQLAEVFSGNNNWRVSLSAIAQQDGDVGDTVQLKNPRTKKLLTGIVTAKGEVEIR